MRVILIDDADVELNLRITPACAGNTFLKYLQKSQN